MLVKLFEDNEYYQEISSEEYYEYPNISYNQKEINRLENVFRDYSVESDDQLVVVQITNKFDAFGYIYKLPDEWYLVCLVHHQPNDSGYYKCDQLEGLIKLVQVLL